MTGVTVSDESIQIWLNQIKQNTVPQIIPDVQILESDNKCIVVFEVIEYPIKPVAYRNKYYKRIANSNHLMRLDEITAEHLKTINNSWDFYPDSLHDNEKISIEKVVRFIDIIEKRTETKITLSPFEFLEKLEFLRDGKLTYGAYLLFVKDYCLISDIQVGRFKSEITIIDSVSLNTDLFTEVDEIIAFIKKHLMVEFIITGNPQREERFDYPLDAIREIVVNMVVHRDYRDSSGSIIKIFDDRIEFYNPGKLYGDITIGDLLSNNYNSKVRNKLIARAFKEAGIIEKYGTGIKRVFDICKDYGIISPKFEERSNGFQVTIFKTKLKVSDKVGNKVGDKVGNNVGDNRLKEIIALIKKNNQISAKQLAKELNVSDRTIERDIEKLKKKGKLDRIGPEKNGHWQVIEWET